MAGFKGDGSSLVYPPIRFKKPKPSDAKSGKKTASRIGTGEEQQSACLVAFDALSKTLRSLSDLKSHDALPLRITSVQVRLDLFVLLVFYM